MNSESTFFQNVWEFIKVQSGKIISTLVILLVTLLIIFIARIITKKYAKRQHGKRKRAITLATLLFSVSRYILLVVCVFAILSVWGINVTSILVGAGIVTLGISLGAQKLIADVISGVCIVFENYYDVDDVVEIDGFKGTVIEIGLKSTKLINWRNETKIISNSLINNVINYSRSPSVGVVEIEISYKENINSVIALLEERLVVIKEQFEQVVEGPNIVGVTNLGSRGVTIRITVKTLSEEHYSVERAIKKYVKEIFDEKGIVIPYDQIVIYNGDENK